MKFFLIIALCLQGYFVFAQKTSEPINPAEKDSAGLKLYEEKKYKEALELFSEAIELSPRAEYYIHRSRTFRNLKMFKECFEDIGTAIKNEPDNVEAYCERGMFFYEIRECDKAIIDFTEALKYAETDSVKIHCLVSRSSAKIKKRDFDGSIADCEEALGIDSNDVGALNNLGLTYDYFGKGEKTMEILEKILRIDSTADYAWANIGFRLSNEGKYRESIGYFDKAIQLNPKFSYTYNNRGYSKYKLNDFKGGLKDINKAIKMNPSNSYAYRNRGLVYLAMDKKTKACEDWDEAIKLGFTKEYGEEVDELIKKNCL